MDDMGEDIDDYKTLWGYSASETEKRASIFNYPEYDYEVVDQLTNFHLEPEQITEEELIDI